MKPQVLTMTTSADDGAPTATCAPSPRTRSMRSAVGDVLRASQRDDVIPHVPFMVAGSTYRPSIPAEAAIRRRRYRVASFASIAAFTTSYDAGAMSTLPPTSISGITGP